MSSITYILQKDLPNLKAGCCFVATYDNYHKINGYLSLTDKGTPVKFLPEEVENNPIWFLSKELDNTNS